MADVADTATAPAETASEPTNLGQVVVLGTRGGPPRTVAESPAPIDVIQAGALNRTGRAELGEAIARTLPSFSMVSNQAGITSVVRPVRNRGLGPAYTLVLVNGKRRHNGAQLTNGGGDTSGVNPVDFDLIPPSLIDYVEVLKDSAAAQYGSDAVAGVINVVLKGDPEGGSVSIMAGRLYEGKGNLHSFKGAFDHGFKLGKGFIHVSGDARFRGLTWNNFPATAPPYAPADNPKNATWNHDGAHNGDPEVIGFNLAYNAELPLDAFTLYSFGTFGSRWTEIGNNLRRPNSTASFSSMFPDGYYPLNNTAEYDLQFVAGGRGEFSGVSFDLSSSYGRSHVRQYSKFTINPSLGPSSPQKFDNLATYRFEQWTQNLDLTKGFEVGLALPLQVSAGIEYRVDKFSTFAGDPLGSENGLYVFQEGDQEGDPNVGKPASPGAQGGVILRAEDEVRLTRGVLAGYLDLGISPTKNWYNGLAVRGEHYGDASGNTFGGKLNSRVDVLPELAFRGTIGSGFRAPSLTQTGYAQTDSRTSTNPRTGEYGPNKNVLARIDSPLARALGAKDLKPEKSVNFGLGTVLRPFDTLNVTVDAYQIEIKDRIGRTTPLTGNAIAPTLEANGLVGTEFVTYFANQVDTRTRGVDVVAEWSGRFEGAGALNLSVAYNYSRTTITQFADTPAELLALQEQAALANDQTSNLVFIGRAVRGDLTVNQPRNKLIIGARWQIGDLSLSVTNTRYGAYRYVRSEQPAQDTRYGGRWLTDVEALYNAFDGFEIGVGAVNVFNVYPAANGPLDPNTGSSNLRFGQPPFSGTGGFYYAKVGYGF